MDSLGTTLMLFAFSFITVAAKTKESLITFPSLHADYISRLNKCCAKGDTIDLASGSCVCVHGGSSGGAFGNGLDGVKFLVDGEPPEEAGLDVVYGTGWPKCKKSHEIKVIKDKNSS
jgi:hypothetical protein